MFNENTKFFLSIVYKITEMMMRKLLSNTNCLKDCREIVDLVFLRLALLKNDKDFILITPFGRQAQDFSNDIVFSNQAYCTKISLYENTDHQ